MEKPPTPITAKDIGFQIGKTQAISDFNCQSKIELVATLSRARQIRNRKKTLGLCWTEICSELAINRRQADRWVRLYNEFGPSYFHISHIIRISPANYRSIAPFIDGDTILIGGENVAINAENATRIRAFVRFVLNPPVVTPSLQSIESLFQWPAMPWPQDSAR